MFGLNKFQSCGAAAAAAADVWCQNTSTHTDRFIKPTIIIYYNSSLISLSPTFAGLLIITTTTNNNQQQPTTTNNNQQQPTSTNINPQQQRTTANNNLQQPTTKVLQQAFRGRDAQ
jgi:hypothetical protein